MFFRPSGSGGSRSAVPSTQFPRYPLYPSLYTSGRPTSPTSRWPMASSTRSSTSSTTTRGCAWPREPSSPPARPTSCAPCTRRLRPGAIRNAFLTDNGRIFTTPPGCALGAMEAELLCLGIATKHSRPYHPQTCGKVERFHQTLKKYLGQARAGHDQEAAPGPAQPLRRALQHRATASQPGTSHARSRRWSAREKAGPIGPRIEAAGYRIRHDKVDRGGR